MTPAAAALYRTLLAERAEELGFAAIGFAQPGIEPRGAAYEAWLDQGFHGEMGWMANHRELRRDSRLLEPGSQTIVVLASPYGGAARAGAHFADEAAAAQADFAHSSSAGASGFARNSMIGAASRPDWTNAFISQYARGADYHEVVRDRLNLLGDWLGAELGAGATARATVDTAPVLERAVAERAGIGWMAKSGMLIRQGLGSTFFLSALFVNVEFEPTATVHPDRCGRCTRCLDACPTRAIVSPGVVDSRLCISYLTIELRGPIPKRLRSLMGWHLYGCDICQMVCPWNSVAHGTPWPEFSPDPVRITADCSRILRMSQHEFSEMFRGSAIKRTKRRGLARNAAVVMGNSGDFACVGPLGEALRSHDEALVRGHAAWALGALGGAAARMQLDSARANETDAWVREEINAALEGAP